MYRIVCIARLALQIPPRALDPNRDGAFGWIRRNGVAYLSNVAVAPTARRRGVARQLVQHAARVAAGWGCRSIGLHVSPDNAAALALYKSLGFRSVGLEPPWVPFVQGRPSGRCYFFVLRLPAGAATVHR